MTEGVCRVLRVLARLFSPLSLFSPFSLSLYSLSLLSLLYLSALPSPPLPPSPLTTRIQENEINGRATAHAKPRMHSFNPTQPTLPRASNHTSPAEPHQPLHEEPLAAASSSTSDGFCWPSHFHQHAQPLPGSTELSASSPTKSPIRLEWECNDHLAIAFTLVTCTEGVV